MKSKTNLFFMDVCLATLKPIKLIEDKTHKEIEPINENTFKVNQNHANALRYSNLFFSFKNNWYAPKIWWDFKQKTLIELDDTAIKRNDKAVCSAMIEASERLKTGTVYNRFALDIDSRISKMAVGLEAEEHFKLLFNNETLKFKLIPKYESSNNSYCDPCSFDGIFNLSGGKLKIDIKVINNEYNTIFIQNNSIRSDVFYYIAANRSKNVWKFKWQTKDKLSISSAISSGLFFSVKNFLHLNTLIARINTAHLLSDLNILNYKKEDVNEDGKND